MDDTNKSIVILGAAGMLGTDLTHELREQGVTPAMFDLPKFDITDSDQVVNAISGSDIVINCAAYTNVEKAESEPKIAYKVNAQAVEQLGQIALAKGVKVIHISTDFVFDAGDGASPSVNGKLGWNLVEIAWDVCLVFVLSISAIRWSISFFSEGSFV